MEQESFKCPICLDPMKDPVTIGCGHSYCMVCINANWDNEDERGGYRCPQCRTTFSQRPALVKSFLLADLLEQLRNNKLPPAEDSFGPEDVACDLCPRSCKALMSCLGCSGSFCEKHLHNILQSPTSKKQTVMESSKMLSENICPRHNEVKNIINHTDQQWICCLCAADEHKAAVAKTKRKRELWVRGKKIHQRLQDLEEDVELLPKNVKVFNVNADVTVKKSMEIFTELVEKVKEVRSEVTQKIRSQQETEVKQVRELLEKLEQEITELKRKDDELKELLDTEDHNQFLRNSPSLSPISESTLPSLRSRPLKYFDKVTPAVSQVRCHVEDVLRETAINI